MRVHGVGPAGDWYWRADQTCSLCGSLSPEQASLILSTRGTAYRVPEWSYGWPEGVMLGTDMFYAVHLVALDDHELAAFAKLTGPLLGITWSCGEQGLDYHAKSPGLCMSGTVGHARVSAEVLRRRA